MTGVDDWVAVYAGYDDDALAIAAGAGTVRRAVKLQASTPVDWQSRGATAGEVRVGELVVRLDGGGPRTARCPCPATGTCVHVLLASRWVRDGLAVQTTDPLAELLGLDPLTLCRSAGIAATRVAAGRAEATGTQVTAAGRQVEISWPGAAHPVVYVAGGGLAGMLSASPPAERSAVHLEAVCRVFLDAGRAWSWPPGVAEHVESLHRPRTLSAAQSDAVDSVAATVEAVAGAGVAHASADAADRLTATAHAARAAGLALLARRTHDAAGLVGGYARHQTDVTERSVGAALAACLALCEALRRSTGGALESLLGRTRREFTATDTLRLVPLGARTWRSTSGARGTTLTVWDVDGAESRSVTSARASGADRGFTVGWDVPTFWGRTVESVCAGPFRLHAPRLAADGSLAATGGSVLSREASDVVDLGALSAIAVDRWADLHHRGLGSARLDDTAARSVLLRPQEVRPVRIDEVRQHLVWDVVDTDGSSLELRQRATPERRRRVDALLELPVHEVVLVLVDAVVDERELLLEPVSVVVRVAGVPRLLALDLAPHDAYRPAAHSWKERQALLDAAHAALERHRPEHRTAGSAVHRVCASVSDVVDQVLATGRRRLSADQRATLTSQAAVARDCALATLASSVDAMLADGDVPVAAVLRTRFVLDRAAALPSGPDTDRD
ncbi:hypothetical protein ASD16_21235 [Cellulomonas sp. Root485]|uniref:hypothetical protein n=1 Tax=Cellulomonas sp. Root485 TaxID=1736546 RepID=UPI0006F1F9A2|nr:hypothetical protein [Cellulomonas sp. Root485]KQY20399.1 hypothetical protein ASD16_21235 [Cellulomonas sp. Root485]